MLAFVQSMRVGRAPAFLIRSLQAEKSRPEAAKKNPPAGAGGDSLRNGLGRRQCEMRQTMKAPMMASVK